MSVDGVILRVPASWMNLSYLAKVYLLCAGGDSVVAGTVNGNGLIVVECVQVGAESALSQIIALVERARHQGADRTTGR